MKIAYVTTYDPANVRSWSGLGGFILRALQDNGFQTHIIADLKVIKGALYRFQYAYYGRFLHKRYLQDRDPVVLKNYAAQVERALADIKCDLVFSPGTIPVAYLETNKPIVFWTDATFGGMVDYYPSFSNLCAKTLKDGHKMEQLALTKCRLAIYSSDWAATTAIQTYKVDPKKIKILPFGANLSSNRTLRDINSILQYKKFDVCRLLFIGVDWFRKGGDTAVMVANLLNKRGIKAELHVVGCKPPKELPSFVKLHGFISKATDEGRKHLDRLFSESHFLILPSRAECFGIVFAEASSFGLPSLATRIGGIPSAIHDGKNGQTFFIEENPEAYSDYIQRLFVTRNEYNELAMSSFNEYSNRLNWVVIGKRLRDLLVTLGDN